MFNLNETVERASIVRKGNTYVVAIKTNKKVTTHSTYTSFDSAFKVWKQLEGINK